METLADNVNHPSHYVSRETFVTCDCGLIKHVECIDVTRTFNFNLGNSIKYIWRSEFKGKRIEDLQKAAWYINDEIKRIQKSNDINLHDHESVKTKEYHCTKCFLTFDDAVILTSHLLHCLKP